MIRSAAALVLAVAMVAVSGCAGSGDPSTVVEPPAPPSSTMTTTTTTIPLAPPVRYRPATGEPAPEVKQAAADVVQVLATYGRSPTPAEDARRRLAGLPVTGDLVAGAAPLLADDTDAAGDVVYPQLGGLTATTASVMVVLRQRRRPAAAGTDSAVTRTIDVRLTRPPGGAWVVSALASVGGEPPGVTAPLAAPAEEVLANPNVELPDSARWDIQAGRVDGRVVELLAELGRSHRLGVTVLATGHPHNVFASRSVSNHTVGRAVDIWAVDGRPVVDQRPLDGPLAALARSLLARGVTELGGPWDLDGPGGASFANTVHQDHLHLAFDA